MWPFKRNAAAKSNRYSKVESPFHSRPILPVPQPIPPLSAIESCTLRVINESPEILAELHQIGPDTLIVHFEEIGTAVADITTSADDDITAHWHSWLEHDQHEANRKPVMTVPAQSLKNGITAEITIPTGTIEILYKGFMFPLGDFDHIIVKPTASLSDGAIQSMLDNLSHLPSLPIGMGGRVRTQQGIRSPLCYNATGSEPDRAAIRKMNRSAFKMWLKDPWGRYRNQNPLESKITTLR